MRSYLAQSQGQTFPGSYGACLSWAVARVKEDPSSVVKVYTARAGERRGKVILEVTDTNVRLIPNGRQTPVKSLPGWK